MNFTDYVKRLEESPKRLVLEIRGASEPLIDSPILQTKRDKSIWHHTTEEFWTPMSLPLSVSVTLGAKNSLQIWTVKTRLLEVAQADLDIDVKLLLPTEEVLHVWIDKRRYL